MGNRSRLQQLVQLYSILNSLKNRIGGLRRLADCSGRLDWPKRGVYFFHEQGECRSDSGDGPRIVRVGTHALRAGSHTTLWMRLSQHRGDLITGGGNHRGSIFRLLIGASLIKKENLDFPSWGKGNFANRDIRRAEIALEQRVSRVIGGMCFLWLPIDDEPGPKSLRAYVERNSIALLSNYNKPALDPPSPEWLGHYCHRQRVRNSGLWNQDCVEGVCDPAFLHIIDRLVSEVKVAA